MKQQAPVRVRAVYTEGYERRFTEACLKRLKAREDAAPAAAGGRNTEGRKQL